MQKRKMAKVICDNCQIEFEKPESEIKRNIELRRRNFCSRNCVGHAMVNNIPPEKRNKVPPVRKPDKYTGLREFIRRVKQRPHEYNIDLEYLLELWNAQQGKCAYTNISMTLPNKSEKGNIFMASLDRIDSSKGYVKGNVQFILTHLNYMKASLSHEETLKLLKLIKESV